MSHKPTPHWIVRPLFPLLVVLSVLGILEGVIRLVDLDKAALRPLLFYLDATPQAYKLAKDPRILFEFQPASFTSEGKSYTHNNLGFRGEDAQAEKAPGVFRIISAGSSNMYGDEVGDRETLTYYLERALNQHFQGAFEVWNGGMEANSLQQVSARAEAHIKQYKPDLVLVQHGLNMRRSFFVDLPFGQFFDQDPSLYDENLRFFPLVESWLGRALVKRWALYRTVITMLNYWERMPSNNPTYPHASARNTQAFMDLYAAYHDQVPMVLLRHTFCFQQWDGIPIIDVIDRQRLLEALRPEFFMTHPPPHVHEAHAYVVARGLQRLYPKLFRPKPGVGPLQAPALTDRGADAWRSAHDREILLDQMVQIYHKWGKLSVLRRMVDQKAAGSDPLFVQLRDQLTRANHPPAPR